MTLSLFKTDVDSNVVVFDFDGTLMEGDAGKELLKALFYRRSIRKIFALTVVLLCMPWIAFYPRHIFSKVGTLLLWSGTFGRSKRNFLRIVKSVAADMCRNNVTNRECNVGGYKIDKNHRPLPSRAYKEGFDVLNHSVMAGMGTVIITGSPAILVKKILRCAVPDTFGRVKIIGSCLSFGMGGVYTKEHCFGEKKLEMARNAGVATGPWKACYTDSLTDLPLLKNSHQKFLVNASPKLLDRLRGIGITDVVVLEWTSDHRNLAHEILQQPR